MTYLLLYALFHLACGVLTYGILFAYVQRQYQSIAIDHVREDAAMSGLVALFGPVGLFIALINSGFAKHGLLYRPSRR